MNVTSGSIEYPIMVCRSIQNDDYWEISCPRTLGFFARLFGKSENSELQNLVNTLDEILQADKTIADIKWYSDYDDLSDGYIHKPAEKRLSLVGKFFNKLFMPVCAAGFILGIIGGIISGKDSILLRIGVTMGFLLIFGYFGLIAVNIWYGFICNVKEAYRKNSKKKWLSWLFFLLFAICFTVLALMSARLIFLMITK